MQYLVPTTSFAIAVWLYGEPLEHGKIVTFVMIWTGLAIFTADTWRKERELRRVVPSRAQGSIGVIQSAMMPTG